MEINCFSINNFSRTFEEFPLFTRIKEMNIFLSNWLINFKFALDNVPYFQLYLLTKILRNIGKSECFHIWDNDAVELVKLLNANISQLY